MIYQFLLRKPTQERNKTFNFLPQRNVILVRAMDLNLDLHQIHAHTVEEMEEFDLTKVFLLFNKLVLNALVVEKKLLIHVMIVAAKVINKLQRKYLLQFQKE